MEDVLCSSVDELGEVLVWKVVGREYVELSVHNVSIKCPGKYSRVPYH